MPDLMSADEIMAVCIKIEQNGYDFYAAAAKAAGTTGARKFFSDLADWENEHADMFKQLRKEIKDSTTYVDDKPGNDLPQSLKSVADSHVFNQDLDGASAAKRCKTPLDLLNLALQFEKDSVVFYAALHEMVPKGFGGEDIGRLVTEELKHITILNNKAKDYF